jgi:hypothetical protein
LEVAVLGQVFLGQGNPVGFGGLSQALQHHVDGIPPRPSADEPLRGERHRLEDPAPPVEVSLGTLPLGDVSPDAHDAHHSSAFPQRARRDLGGQILARAGQDAELEGGDGLAVQSSCQEIHGQREVLRVDERVEGFTQPFVARPTGDGSEGGVERPEGAICPDREDGVGGALDQRTLVRGRIRGRGGRPALGQVVHVHAPELLLSLVSGTQAEG